VEAVRDVTTEPQLLAAMRRLHDLKEEIVL
jgi:hypothetical protein